MNYVYIILLFLILIFLSPENIPVNEKVGIDIEQYDFIINYFDKSDQNILNVEATILLKKNPGIDEIELLFNQNSRISIIKCKYEEDWVSLDSEFPSDNTIKINLPSYLSPAEEITLFFKYDYPIDDSIETICYLDRGYRWYPLIIDDIAQFRMSANVPNEFLMFSAGDLNELEKNNQSSTYTWGSKIPVFKVPFILIRESIYWTASKKTNEKEILFYFLNKDFIPSEKILNESEKIFQFCDTLIGSYHHHQLTFIEIPEISGSMIGTGIVVVGSDFIQQYKQEYYNGLHLSIAAQWFGCSVFGKFQDKGFWFFSLSLPHYLRLMYIESTKSKEAFEKELKELYEKYSAIADSEKDFPILSIDMIDTKEKGLAIYGKGPYLINILRKQLDDQIWISFLQSLYDNNKGKVLTYENFKNLLSEINNNLNLDQKFEEMMRTKGSLKKEI